jgi:hypothetical protein
MNYATSRALEISRLSAEQIERLHSHEVKTELPIGWDPESRTYTRPVTRHRRCLMAYEIQAMFNLSPLRQHYEIEDSESGRARAAVRADNAISAAGLFPEFEHLSAADVDRIHEFDSRVCTAFQTGKLLFSLGSPTPAGRVSSLLKSAVSLHVLKGEAE